MTSTEHTTFLIFVAKQYTIMINVFFKQFAIWIQMQETVTFVLIELRQRLRLPTLNASQ